MHHVKLRGGIWKVRDSTGGNTYGGSIISSGLLSNAWPAVII